MTDKIIRPWSELHEAAKKLYKSSGKFIILVKGSSRNLLAGEYGVHGSMGGLVFGTCMDDESDSSRELVDESLKRHGY